ncbi:glucose-methanol-choline oxidoreductase [Penicillium sp. IBT 18751x]|nr:glucose-methanol-choline oxidoreductase [Penicillium sp. IBT 18751x]
MRPHLSAQILGAILALSVPLVNALAPRTEIADSYDFVILGGGQAGLVLGGRLSEDLNHTVLVLEAGENGDAYRDRIDSPADSYFDSLWTTPLNWAYYTVPQANANDREIEWPRGKTLGGSSAINGLYMTRPGVDEINAWKDMLGDMNGANNWGWESFYAALKKSETFDAPSEEIASQADISWDMSTHGSSGPIHASYPGFTFAQVGQWTPALEALGVATSTQMYGGENWGAEVSTSCINPANWTRSYSRTGYLDPLADNGNYDVLANAHVTRIIFDGSFPSDNLTAKSVEYTTDRGSTFRTVNVTKEVILAAGSVNSPAILMYSGVGPKDVLSDADVDLISDLPGVGQHLQDHISATVTWTTDVDTAGSIYYDNLTEKSNPLFDSYINSAIAYINASYLDIEDMDVKILNSIDLHAPNTTYDAGVIAGHRAICNTTVSNIMKSPTGLIELLFMNSDASGIVGITAALQHPFSHGRIYINSSNPVDSPVIDPNYLSNTADYEILLAGLKMARSLGETSPLSNNLTGETAPGSSVTTDEQWLKWIRKNVGTEFHPSSSCAMLPRDQGGVVDANLRVYGLANVRVADASVPPIALSTHLMASTYGLAEQASTIIREFHNPRSSITNSSIVATSTTGSSSSTMAPKKSNDSPASCQGASFQTWESALVFITCVAVFVRLGF